MKKAMTALFAIAAVAAASAFAADKTDVPAPAVDNGARPRWRWAVAPCRRSRRSFRRTGPVLFSATVATDTPAETINKLTALIPASPAKHYEVHVEVCPLPGMPTGNSPCAVA
ncbi:Uncharacterised protein [Klebsiella aerogenes]|nr:Uncharacterised protein [Klebsiella aerogenes]